MNDVLFLTKCLNDTLQGLREGLSHFSGPSSVGIIYQLPGQKNLSIFDPHSLLRGHEVKIKSFYYGSKGFQRPLKGATASVCYRSIKEVEPFEIDGMLSYGGSSATVPYQMWFTEHHPDLLSPGPTLQWLAHAVLRFSHDMANTADLYTGISGDFLREYSTHAIHEYLLHEVQGICSVPFHLDIFSILHAILGVLQTREEGIRPSGYLAFVPPEHLEEVDFIAHFVKEEMPQLKHHKHVRKLLQSVALTQWKLISDGTNILGIGKGHLPKATIIAEYLEHYGYLHLDGTKICSFSDGRYRSSSLKAKLFEVEESLLDYDLDPETRDQLFTIIATLVHNAQLKKHGCTFVIDLNEVPIAMSGQLLQRPLELTNPQTLALACNLSRVDGALHICKDKKLHSFACLLDGHSIQGEDRARGARYNCALRFTQENPQAIVVVVSSDRPVSVIQQGIVLHDRCPWNSSAGYSTEPIPLADWLAVTA